MILRYYGHSLFTLQLESGQTILTDPYGTFCDYPQRVLKADAILDDGIVRRVSAAQIEGAVVSQVRALLRQPEIVVGTWLAARRDAPDLMEREVRDALHRLDPLWGELFPAEQARIVRALVGRVEVGPAGAGIRLRVAAAEAGRLAR